MQREPADVAGLQRRDVLKLGLGFSLAAGLGTALVGCGDAPPAAGGYLFLKPADVALFGALVPAVVGELASFDDAKRRQLVDATLKNIDGSLAALQQGSAKEVRKLLDLLAMGPLRYALTGIASWDEAGVDKMHAFLARWRGSRFATLNAGGNVLVKLTASSFYVLPASWPSTGYPGPLAYVFNAIQP